MGRSQSWGNNGMGAATPEGSLAFQQRRSNASSADTASNNALLVGELAPAVNATSSGNENDGDGTNSAEGQGEVTSSPSANADTTTGEDQQLAAGHSKDDVQQALRDMDSKWQTNTFDLVNSGSSCGSGHTGDDPNQSLGLVGRLNQLQDHQTKGASDANLPQGKSAQDNASRGFLSSFSRTQSPSPTPTEDPANSTTLSSSTTSQAPGAVAIFPDRNHLSVRRDEEQGGISGELPWQSGHSRDGLVEARALSTSREFLEEAFQVPLSELQQSTPTKKTTNQERVWNLWILIALVLVVIVSVGLGFGLGLRKQDNKNLDRLPTVVPSLTPTQMPSTAPTGAMDPLVEILPEYTRQSLKVFDSPQWKAGEWLAMHPNLANLPLWRQTQLFALATFFYSFQGPLWRLEVRDNWLQYDVNECDWFSSRFGRFDEDGRFEASNSISMEYLEGSPCNANGEFQNLRLRELEMQASNAVPEVPPEIALLTSLAILDLDKNRIGASISDWLPSQIYQMDSLTALFLRFNKLTGTIPSQIASLTNLRYLALARNSLTGSIPTQVGMLSNLGFLKFNDNALSGPIPSQIGLMTNMEYLGLWNNALSGSMPSTLFGLRKLAMWGLDNNALTGTIATEFGILAGSLRVVGLHLNRLSGSLPTELGLLSNVTQLATTYNPLSGPIPSEVGMMASLQNLDLSMSFLEGSIPTQLGLLSGLTESLPSHGGGGMSLEGNSLVGTIPTQLALLRLLNALSLRNNPLTGSIPTEFGAMSLLDGLYLGETNLSGSIPSQFGGLQRLGVLELSKMPLLAGSVPQELSLLTTLKVLRLDGSDQLSGTIPEILCSIESNGSCSLGYWWLQYRLDTKECALEFDCTGQLCGCNCPCSG